MLSAHRLFDLPGQHLFHSGGVRCIKDAFLFQKVFKRGASIGIFRHGFHTPFCAYLLTLSPVVESAESLSMSFSHSLTGSVPEAVLKNLAGRIFSESFIRMLYHIWYNMSSPELWCKSLRGMPGA